MKLQHVVIIPDSFKGSLSSMDVCALLEGRVHTHFPDCRVTAVPVADGGEGTVESFFAAVGGELIACTVKGPYLEPVGVCYLVKDGVAVIEMAKAAGLPLVEDRKNPMLTSTFGVGEMIADAVKRGCRKIVLGLGGSCTNDAGTGMAAALGCKFYDSAGREFLPVGGTLADISSYDMTELSALMADVTISAMCDIDNKMFGKNGAAYVFGPQKGADCDMVKVLDAGLKSLHKVILKQQALDVADLPGAGAAGALGAGVAAFLSGTLRPGIEAVLDLVQFEDLLTSADLVFTGEGKIDSQSLRGKVVIGVARRAKAMNVPVIALVGDVGDGIGPVYDMGVSAVFSINQVAVPFSEARKRSGRDLAETADNVLRLIKTSSGCECNI